ncbi:GCN5-related N-acetyltransferase [Gloeothece citriformis PCC 7424]|uniref:GCN5-related N-acetyltransferase n=1 Tax=Gloeothece citriformis (strain PCC 7424) TaxID=65393 RepID=B7KET2_GLOC7|nr:GNAT family N-acetyltransferase [Gloeothece citriformis]ACK69107.1 GCN5-related N-acetyltransferase [Gloeothece citriformis PCC 7424]
MDLIQIQPVNYQQEKIVINTIRTLVFQQEQGVAPELEFDGQDETATHLLAYLNDKPVGTLRIRQLQPEIVKIERLAVLKPARGQGIGKKLMISALTLVQKNPQIKQVTLNAQDYIKKLYETLGFEQIGDRFDEAGIPHVKMIKQLPHS